jgi:hypothetical protein
MESVVIFYGHLEYFTAIWYNLWPFGLVCGHLVYYCFRFGPRKIWQPWSQTIQKVVLGIGRKLKVKRLCIIFSESFCVRKFRIILY